jgi:hypothetical protein
MSEVSTLGLHDAKHALIRVVETAEAQGHYFRQVYSKLLFLAVSFSLCSKYWTLCKIL